MICSLPFYCIILLKPFFFADVVLVVVFAIIFILIHEKNHFMINVSIKKYSFVYFFVYINNCTVDGWVNR